MQTIKFLQNNHIRLNNKTYKGYHIGDIPKMINKVNQSGLTTKV